MLWAFSTSPRPRKFVRSATPPGAGSVSVVLPADLRRKISLEARRRGLKLSPALHVLIRERFSEIEETEGLTRAEEWQRAQAWATWEAVRAGREKEVSWDDLEADYEAARRKAR